MDLLSPAALLAALVVAAVLGSLAAVRRLDGAEGRWGTALRSRWVMGVPWGTLVAATLIVVVYLFVQGGRGSFGNPVTIPFRAWSLSNPLGVVVASFAHDGPNHLLGNLVGTLVLGSIAEYAWGHFPRERGTSSFGSPLRNPWVRALVVAPVAIVAAGLVGAVVSIGPVIGFSGVVFAFAGFALTRYPLGTVVGIVGAGAVRTVYGALTDPVVTATAQPSPPAPPWWAGIAIQGHAVGLFLGVLAGAVVFGRRDERPSALRLWAGVALFAMEQALWAVYWFRGDETFVLYRGPGVALVATLALLVVLGVTASDRRLLPRRLQPGAVPAADGGRPDDGQGDGVGSDGRPGDDRGWRDRSVREISRRQAALALLLLGFGLLAGPGVGSNLVTVADASPPGEGVVVRDYTVSYAEGVENEMVGVVDVSVLGETTEVTASGVVVTSRDRGIWQQAVSERRLAYDGRVTVRVGGLGWREDVTASRRGWSAAGGETAYRVWLQRAGEDRRRVFSSAPATADPTLAGRNVSVAPASEGFELRVTRDNATLGTAPIPTGNATTAAGLEFRRDGRDVYAVRDGTRVRVATEERYR